eukprot:11924453-Alexandrium_andersonii.AAC.1
MSASLVGSEMCIRDRNRTSTWLAACVLRYSPGTNSWILSLPVDSGLQFTFALDLFADYWDMVRDTGARIA